MKTNNLKLAQLIFSGSFFDFDLYTITLFNGNVVRFTTADFPIFAAVALGSTQLGAATYPTTPFVDQKESKTQAHWKIGFDTDQWTVVIMPRPFDAVTGLLFPDTVGGQPWLQAASGGFFDAADFQVDRAYFQTMPVWGNFDPMKGAAPFGTITIFAGTVAEVDTTDSICVMTVNDYRSLLTYSMPRHYYEAQCRHTLYDTGCTLVRNNYAVNGHCGAGSNQNTIVPLPAGLVPNTSPPNSGTFVLGTIQMTSGQNAGFIRTIHTVVSNQWTLVSALPFPVAVGDTFQAFPGCNKLLNTCIQFANEPNFGGQPFIPNPELAST